MELISEAEARRQNAGLPSMEERIEAGLQLLEDRYGVDRALVAYRVNPEILNMRDIRYCVVGQTLPDADKLFDGEDEDLAAGGELFGFDITDEDYVGVPVGSSARRYAVTRAYDELTEAWKAKLEAIREGR